MLLVLGCSWAFGEAMHGDGDGMAGACSSVGTAKQRRDRKTLFKCLMSVN